MEIAEFVFIVLSFTVSIISIVISLRNRQLSDASVELEIRTLIRESRKNLNEISVPLLVLQKKNNKTISDDEEIQLEVITMQYEVAKEELLNSYEEACFKHIDNKIDKERFKKTYIKEIKQIVENENFKKYLDTINSPYSGIKKVYEEWSNLEKRSKR